MFAQVFIAFLIVIASVNAFSPLKGSRMVTRLNADIVDTAVANGSFKTLAAALGAAKLVDTLKGKGPFTVFAPTDAAFAKLPAGTVDALLKDIPKLTSILTYHVVAGEQRPTRNGRTYDTLNGKEISVKVTVDTTESLMYGGQANPARIINMGVKCDNGVIHVIDEVLLPYEGSTAPLHN